MLRGCAAVVLAALIVLVVVAVSGCGGDGGGDGDQLSQAEYRKQAAAICTQANAQKDKAVAKAYENPTKAGIASNDDKQIAVEILAELALPPIATMNDELRGLAAPGGTEVKAEQMVDAFEAEVAKLEANPNSVLNGGGEFQEANELARELGLRSCSEI